MSSAPSSPAPESLANPRKSVELKLVEEQPPRVSRNAPEQSEPSLQLSPLSALDWAISVGFGASVLAYLAGIALCVRWLLGSLFGG